MSTITRTGLPRPDAVLLRLKLIGRMEALTLDNGSVLPLGRKTRGLLAILALAGRKPVLRLRLAELLWSRRSEEQARASLRQEIHRLGEALSPLGTDVITVERHTLALKPALTSVDVERILTARPDQAETLPPIEGVLLEELNGTDPALDLWIAAERIRLHDHAVGLFEEMLRRQRDPQGTLDAARQLLVLDGQHQRAWQATIQAQQQLGNDALARQLAERCLAVLDAGGISPAGPALRDLLQSFRLDHDRDAPAYEISPSATDRPGTGAPQVPPAPGPNASALPDPAGLRTQPAASHATAAPPVPVPSAPAGHGGPPPVAIVPVLVLDAGSDATMPPFAAGLAQALQAALIGNRWCSVLSGSELQDSLQQGRDDAVLRRRFGARYVIDGTMQRTGDLVRVILRLSDTGENGQLLWAQRFDGRADALLALQDTVSTQTAARLPWELVMAEALRSRRRPEAELDPASLSAVALHRLGTADRAQTAEATLMLLRGIEKAPDSMHLHAVLATAHLLAALQRWGDPEQQADLAEHAARGALDLDAANPVLMATCAYVLSELRNRPDAAMTLVQRALSLAPHAAGIWAVGAHALVRLGRLEEAAQFFRTYKDLFATDPFQFLVDLPEVMIPLLRGDNEDAARFGLLHTELRPGCVPILVPYLAALGHLRQTGEAERIRVRLLQSWPDSSVEVLVGRAGLSDPAQAERLRNGLVLAGLPLNTDGNAGGPLPGRPATGRSGARRARPPLGAEPVAG